MKKHLKTLLVLAGIFLGWGVLLSWGADPHAQQGHGEGGLHLSGLFFAAANFLIFIYLLYRLAYGWVKDRLRQRHESVVQTLSEARRAKEEAKALKHQYEERLRGLAQEQEKLREQMLAVAERERQRMWEESLRMAERIRQEARSMAQREMEEARQALRQEVARMAVDIAARLIRERLGPADQGRLLQGFIHEVEDAGSRI